MRSKEQSTQHDLVQLSAVNYRVNNVHVLRDVNFSLRASERVALLGANGAGKTSLLRIVHGLVSPKDSSVHVPPPTAQAMIFQKPPLLKRSARENLEFVLRARGAARDDARAKATDLLERCDLLPLADRYARALSGGEQQKLALARAWALQPSLLLADEPTASLAPAAVLALERLMQAMCESGTTLIFATHNRGQARRLATRIVFMSEGRVVEDRATEDFFANPASTEAIDYLNVERI
jgi:tungstate transport system ATP-binding protein